LTVHHRDHNHDSNPVGGSNWELPCLYCHDNAGMTEAVGAAATHNPFADLKEMPNLAVVQTAQKFY